MKRLLCVMMIMGLMFTPGKQIAAQEQELAQLILNVEKLLQFKQILSDMKQGYDILTQGYNAVRDISEGNFSLHKVFLDGLLEVSPSVRRYKKIADIISMQLSLVKEYKSAWKRFATSEVFNEGELDHIQAVYNNLFDESLRNLDDLTIILTAGKLRMSDDERLAAIDRIYDAMSEKISFLRQYNNRTSVSLLQRVKEFNDAKGVERMYLK